MKNTAEYKIVNVDFLNLRTGPSTNYDILTSIPKGTEVELIPKSEEWSVVNYNGQVGYALNIYLSENKSDGSNNESVTLKVVNTDKLNFRKGPSTSFEIIQVIKKGSKVQYISEENGWTKIKYNNNEGYVYTKYISDEISNSDNTTSTSAESVIDFAKKLLGKPYRWADEGPNSFDCSGFTWYVFKNVAKISLPRSSSEQGKYGTYIDKKDLKPADLIFFDTVGAYDKKITHVGLYMGDGKFIHASSGQGKVVISDLNMNYYLKAYVLGRRILK